MQKEPSALACDIANLFPPDLWGYAHGFSYWFNSWVDYVWQISLRRTWWGFEHGFGHKLGIKSKSQHTIKAQSLEAMLPTIILIVTSVSLPEQDTTRKGRVYKMYENTTRIRPPLSRLLIVRPSQAQPFQALPCEHHLLRLLSYGCSWRAQTSGCQQPTWVKGCQSSTIRLTWVKGCQSSTIRLTWVKGCQLSTIQMRKWPVWLSSKSTPWRTVWSTT